jgi:ubiquinone/menaquinone biosynthesis C-methylase UbiE
MNSDVEIARIRAAYARWEGTLDKSNPGFQMSARQRDRALARLLDEHYPSGLRHCRILDIGCGVGELLGWFHDRGAQPENLFGVDLLPHRIVAARQNYPGFSFIEGNAEQLEFACAWFDIVTVFTVFSSILDDDLAKSLATTIQRLLKPNGVVAWYDMRYQSPNRNVRPFTRRRIAALFPGFQLRLKSLTLLPPLYRHLGRMTGRVYPLLVSVPILRSHYIGLLHPSRFSLAEIDP